MSESRAGLNIEELYIYIKEARITTTKLMYRNKDRERFIRIANKLDKLLVEVGRLRPVINFDEE